MPTFSPIFVRSPRILNVLGTSVNDVASVDIFIWTINGSQPTSPTYTLNKQIPSPNNLTVHFDISPYCREFIKHLNYTPVNDMTQVLDDEFCFVKTVTKLNKFDVLTSYFVAFDGYGYHNQGFNPNLGDVHLDEGLYYVRQNQLNFGGVYYYGNGNDVYSVTYTSLTTGLTTSYGLDDGYNYLPYLNDNYLAEGNKMEIFKNSALIKTFTFEPICEPKYTPVVCDFVNRYGSWQRIIFFKASRQSFEANGSEFNLMPDSVNYNVFENRKQTFNRNGVQSIKVNTGFVPENYKDVMKQLLLSEKIMIDDQPAKLRTQSVELQEHITKKLINYELEFEYSFEQRNYIV